MQYNPAKSELEVTDSKFRVSKMFVTEVFAFYNHVLYVMIHTLPFFFSPKGWHFIPVEASSYVYTLIFACNNAYYLLFEIFWMYQMLRFRTYNIALVYNCYTIMTNTKSELTDGFELEMGLFCDYPLESGMIK